MGNCISLLEILSFEYTKNLFHGFLYSVLNFNLCTIEKRRLVHDWAMQIHQIHTSFPIRSMR